MRGAVMGMAAFVLLAGCAGVEPGRGFDDVRREVAERAGARVHWETGGPEDAEAEGAVRGLLAEELTADGAVQVALLNNRGLRATYEQLNMAQADLVRAGLLRNPVFDAAVRWPTPGSGYGVDLGVAMSFLDVFWIPLRKRIAEAAFEGAKLRVTGEVLELAGAVRERYYEAVAAEERAAMLATVLEAFGASYELAQRLHAAGNIRDLDLSNERAAYEEAKVALSQARAEAAVARESLNELMGLWGERTAWRTAGRLPAVGSEQLPTSAEAERRAVERSLELAGLRRELEIAARRAGLRMASEEMHAAAVRVRARARALVAAAGEARERAEYYRGVILPLRERIVSETQLQYNAMQVSPLQLLQAKREQVRAGGEYVEALRDYWVNRARLEMLMAGGMGGEVGVESREDGEAGSADSGAGGH